MAMKKSIKGKLILGAIIGVLFLGLMSYLIPMSRGTIYVEQAPDRNCVDFLCLDYFEQGDRILFTQEATTWNHDCDYSTETFSLPPDFSKDFAVSVLNIYLVNSLAPIATIYGNKGRFSFSGNTQHSDSFSWKIPYNFPSGKYKAMEHIICYKDVEVAGSILTGEITGFDEIVKVSTDDTAIIVVSRETPCLSSSSSRCVGYNWKECTSGDSYTKYVWKTPRPVIGKCNVKCVTSNDCGSNQKCDNSFKCVDVCQPRFDKFCKSERLIYERNSCTGEESYKELCSSGEKCEGGECVDACPPTGAKPCDDAIITRVAGCDVWDDSSCELCPPTGVKPCDNAVLTRVAGCDVWDDSSCDYVTVCTDGEVDEQGCPDGSWIEIARCINGEMQSTDQKCPEKDCHFDSDCAEGYKCVDGGICEEDEIDIVKDECEPYISLGALRLLPNMKPECLDDKESMKVIFYFISIIVSTLIIYFILGKAGLKGKGGNGGGGIDPTNALRFIMALVVGILASSLILI